MRNQTVGDGALDVPQMWQHFKKHCIIGTILFLFAITYTFMNQPIVGAGALDSP